MRGITSSLLSPRVLLGIDTWIGVRTSTPTGALAGSSGKPMMIGAKVLTLPDEDYDIVEYCGVAESDAALATPRSARLIPTE